jgi:TldD protein
MAGDWENEAAAIEAAKRAGATYADARVVLTETESWSVSGREVSSPSRSYDFGIGVRVIAGGAWGFAASWEVTEESAAALGKRAVEIARAGAILRSRPVELAPAEALTATYSTPVEIDPFALDADTKREFLLGAAAPMLDVDGVTSANGSLDFRRQTQRLVSSEGAMIRQVIVQSGAGIAAAVGGAVTRSYPTSQGGQFGTGGFEFVRAIDFAGNARRIAEEAVALGKAPECPTGEMDLILDGPEVSLLIHESVGHALELDRVFGSEANFSGTSFATTDKLGKLQYGSKTVNIVSDPTAPGGLATYGYDDEGVRAYRADLIRDGVLVNYLSSRETAQRIGKTSTAAMRADGWGNVPLIRITNVNLSPGEPTLDELIADTKQGIFMSGSTSWSIDDRREGLRMGCEVGRRIEGGKLGEMVKSPGYSGNTLGIWNSCDAVCNKEHWRIWGTANCGKGQPGQNARTGQGAAPARFRRVRIG